MRHVQLTLSANAGLALQLADKRIWIDAVHSENIPGMSALSELQWQELLRHPAFTEPDLLFFTHCHGDHFSADRAAHAASLWPRAALALPEQKLERQSLLSGSRLRVRSGSTEFLFLKLTHEGPEFVDVPHYGLLVDDNGYRILFTGDCEVASPELMRQLDGMQVDLAVVDFPWITLRKGREFLQNVLRPRQLAVCHIPFAKDDEIGARQAALRAAAQLPNIAVRLFLEPFQSERFSCP